MAFCEHRYETIGCIDVTNFLSSWLRHVSTFCWADLIRFLCYLTSLNRRSCLGLNKHWCEWRAGDRRVLFEDRRSVSKSPEILTGILHRLDDRGSKHPWNVDRLLPDYTALQPRRKYPSLCGTVFRRRSPTECVMDEIKEQSLRQEFSVRWPSMCSVCSA